MPDLRPIIERYYAAMLDLTNVMLRGFALALALPERYFLPKFDRCAAWLRLSHYPPQPDFDPADTLSGIGIGEHTDFDAFTILWQDASGGLEVRTLDGTWVAAPPIPGTYVINIANLMQRWTNDIYRSNPHRAINRSGGGRLSVPFFVNANPDAVVECIPTCKDGAHPALYAPITAAEWVRARVLESQPFRETEPAAE
ncbi:MAG: 2OG-Fe(II) oxygenase family protein [Alphaproteobacteria bacterium]